MSIIKMNNIEVHAAVLTNDTGNDLISIEIVEKE
jgi:hypothetical protein